MLCRFIQLRNRGDWKPRSELAGRPGAAGVLDYRKADPNYWGRTMQARLLAIKGEASDILPVLQYARVLTIKEGGVLIDGMEITSRGVKSKAIHTRQTWWCITEHEPGYAVLERWAPRSSSGFDVNDDDLVDGDSARPAFDQGLFVAGMPISCSRQVCKRCCTVKEYDCLGSG